MGNKYSGQIRTDILTNIKIADFHPKQIDFMREKFVLMCDDDLTVGIETFAQLIRMKATEAKDIFNYFDIDQSGKIDSYEFICALALISHANLKQKAAAIFRLYDFDNSLVLNFDEMVVLIRCCLCSLAAMSGRRDIPSIDEVEEKVTTLFRRHDKDGDGQISLEEFQGIVTKDREILETLRDYHLLKSYDLRENYGPVGEELPMCDSDLEIEELKGVDVIEEDEKLIEQDDDFVQMEYDRIRQGIDFKIVKKGDQIYELDTSIRGKPWLSDRPWNAVTRSGKPKESKIDSSIEGTMPDVRLELEHVYGYRCHDSRNNLAYSPSGSLIYHTAAIGIVLDRTKTSLKQSFFKAHNDDIISMATYESIVATGQAGITPSIHIWDSKELTSKGVVNFPLKKGVGHLCFSHDGRKLAAISIEEDTHTIAVYDVETILNSKGETNSKVSLLCHARGPEETVFGMTFDQNNNSLAIACKGGLYFAALYEETMELAMAQKWTAASPPQTILCVISMNQQIVGGSYSGKILIFKDGNLIGEKEGHESPVTALHCRKKGYGFISADKDGLILFWDGNCNATMKKIKLREVDRTLNSYKIRAVCEDANKDIAVGTRGGEIVEIKNEMQSAEVLTRGHFNYELWGICAIPNTKKFVTVGEDRMLAFYDIDKRQIEHSLKIPFSARCVEASPEGKRLAIGCKNGYVLIYDVASMKVFKTLKDRESEITCLKFSSDGEWLSVAGGDCQIIHYKIKNNYSLNSRMRAHKEKVLHFDFNEENTYIQSVCEAGELIYSKVQTGQRIKSGFSKFKDEVWSTWTLPVGWHTQGIWPPCSSGEDINAVAYSQDLKILASVDDFGLLKTFRFPVSKPHSAYSQYLAHSSHATNAIFVDNSNYLLTTGGFDKTVMQWRIDATFIQQEYLMTEDGVDKDQMTSGPDEEEALYEELEQFKDYENNPQGYHEKPEEKDEDEMIQVKSYMGHLKRTIPGDFKPADNYNESPNQNLELYHVFGYNAFGTKNVVKYTNSEKIVFVAACLGVVMSPDPKDFSQSFFNAHNHDIVSMAIHPINKQIVATGQKAKLGESKLVPIYIWEVDTKRILAVLQGYHRCAVNILKFSPDGSILLSIGKDEYNSVALYDWANNRLIAQTKVDKYFVTDASFKKNNTFVTVGLKHIKFWEINGNSLKFTPGRWGNLAASSEPLVSVCNEFLHNKCFTGGRSGKIYGWNNVNCVSDTIAHSGPIRVLIKHNNTLYSGGDDGVIKMWSNLTKLQKQGDDLLKMGDYTNYSPGIRSIDIKKDNTLLVATRGCEIFEVVIDDEIKVSSVLRGHFGSQIFGLAAHPSNTKFVTIASDRTIRIWDGGSHSKRMIHHDVLETVATAVDWSLNGENIVVGLENGSVLLLDENLNELYRLTSSFTDSRQLITVLKISPNNELIAFGATNSNDIEVHSIINNKLVSKGVMKGMNSPVTHLDWSNQSSLIMANSDSFEHNFFSHSNMKIINFGSMKDENWHTWTCTLGWAVQGIYPHQDGRDVVSVCRATNGHVLATGDVFGQVKLFRYPSIEPKSDFKVYKGHSAQVNGIRFISNDNYLVSTGSQDSVIIVWKTDFGYFEGLDEDVPSNVNLNSLDKRDLATVEAEAGDSVYNKYGVKENLHDEGKEIRPYPDSAYKNPLFGTGVGGNPGEALLAIKPWEATIKPPSKFLKPSVNYAERPRIKVKLHHVFGYHSKNIRGGVKMRGDEVLYFTAAVAISQHVERNSQMGSNSNPNANHQKFFLKHKSEISALALSQDERKAATGDSGKRPTIYLWDTDSLITLLKINDHMEDGVRCLKFSNDDTKLLVITCDSFNSVVIFDTFNGALIAKARGDSCKILDCVWTGKRTFSTVGIQHFKRWELKRSGVLSDKRGLFHNKKTSKKSSRILVCCNFFSGIVLVGAYDGGLQIWMGNRLEDEHLNHNSCIDSIAVTDE